MPNHGDPMSEGTISCGPTTTYTAITETTMPV